MSRDSLFLNPLVKWLHERAAERRGRFVLLTLTFSRYCKFAYTVPSPTSFAPTRADVLAGLAQPMPQADARAALIKDLDRFCCFMMRALFGRRYSKRFASQPLAIGALDEPHYKGASQRSAHARKPGDRFEHAHFVLFLPDVPVARGSLIERFEELIQMGRLQEMWKKLNPTGELHVIDIFDLAGAVDYAFKSAKLAAVPADELMLWPAALPKQSLVLTRSTQASGGDLEMKAG